MSSSVLRRAPNAGWAASDESHPSRSSLRWSAKDRSKTGGRCRWPLVDRFEDGPVSAPVHRVLDEEDSRLTVTYFHFELKPSTR